MELLLRLLGSLEQPDSGTVSVLGEILGRSDHPTFAHRRNSLFGYLFRQPYLLPSFSVAENIAMPLLRIRGVSAKEACDRTRFLLKTADLLDLTDLPVYQLALPTQQQVALIRALVHFPKILIITSPPLSSAILSLIRLAAYSMGTTVICAGEENSLATLCDHLFIVQEKIVYNSRSILETIA
jgi:ABC-type lipoprotein export system ATPase subunit